MGMVFLGPNSIGSVYGPSGIFNPSKSCATLFSGLCAGTPAAAATGDPRRSFFFGIVRSPCKQCLPYESLYPRGGLAVRRRRRRTCRSGGCCLLSSIANTDSSCNNCCSDRVQVYDLQQCSSSSDTRFSSGTLFPFLLWGLLIKTK